MKSTKTKEQVYRESFNLFTAVPVPEDLLSSYLVDEYGEASLELQSWIVNNLRKEISDWATGIGVIEAVDLLYNSAVENGTI